MWAVSKHSIVIDDISMSPCMLDVVVAFLMLLPQVPQDSLCYACLPSRFEEICGAAEGIVISLTFQQQLSIVIFMSNASVTIFSVIIIYLRRSRVGSIMCYQTLPCFTWGCGHNQTRRIQEKKEGGSDFVPTEKFLLTTPLTHPFIINIRGRSGFMQLGDQN